MTKQKVKFEDLDRLRYQEAWDYQTSLHKQLIANKLHNRKFTESDEEFILQQHHLLFCEHAPVYTLGKSGSMDHLLLNEGGLKDKEIEFFKINRGGDITFHGPGQIVGYPIFDLDEFFTDVHKYVRYLEEAIIRTIAEYGVKGTRTKGYTGVWLEAEGDKPLRKICAIGVHLSRWVTLHGFAFNVNTNLDYFKYIIPCGINDSDKAVTSLQMELGHSVDFNEVKTRLKGHFAELFGFEYVL